MRQRSLKSSRAVGRHWQCNCSPAFSGTVPQKNPLRKDLKVSKNGNPLRFMGDSPHSKKQHGRKLRGALLARGTMQAAIVDFNTE